MPEPIIEQTILPSAPFDGQIYIDAYRVKWSYNAEDKAWSRQGVVNDIPIARSDSNPLGPTNGLFSAKDKVVLDSLSEKAGGFGIILKPGYYVTTSQGVENVLTGDVNLLSNTLKFTCDLESLADCKNSTFSDQIPAIKVGLSQDFLDSFRCEIKGPTGPKGNKGPQGDPGRPGTGDGPQGDPGKDGKDATTVGTFSGVLYEESTDIYDTAVVGLNLDSQSGVLEVTKAKMNVPSDDKPASRVAASPLIRDVEFLADGLTKWQLVTLSGDDVPIDLNVIKLPKGWVGGDEPVPVASVRLSQVVQSIIDYYDTQTSKVVDQWDTELKEWAISRDAAARAVLHDLAVQLSQCEFQKPLEFCLGVEPSDCHPESSSSAQ